MTERLDNDFVTNSWIAEAKLNTSQALADSENDAIEAPVCHLHCKQ